MHLLLAALGAVVTILILLNKLNCAGIDLTSFNPFLWHRRRQWHIRYHGHPAFNIQKPMEAVALLVTVIAKLEGEISREQKNKMHQLYQSEFGLSDENATALMSASVFILRDGEDLSGRVNAVLTPSLDRFSEAQAGSALEMMLSVAQVDSTASGAQQMMIDRTRKVFEQQFSQDTSWA